MLRKNIFILVFLVALTGCASITTPYEQPKAEVAAQFATLTPELAHEKETGPQWWTRFDDPVLEQLVEEGLASNHDVLEAVARVEAAQAFRREATLELLPFGGAGVAQQHSGVAGDRARTVSADVEVGWELDLFGRIRGLSRAAGARSEEIQSLLEQTQIVVTAEIARNYLSLRAIEQRIAMLEQYAADQSRIVEIIAVRVEEGIDDEGDLARARTVEAEDALALAQERHRSRLHRSALAVLTGRSPVGFELPPDQADSSLTFQTIAIGDPRTLLARRPDVRAAERELAAQTAEIGVATAGLFPQIRLGGAFGFVAGSFGELGSSDGESWLVGPSLSWGIFDLTRVRAQIRREKAEAEGALAAWEGTVLRALEDAQNSFSSWTAAQESLASSDALMRSARTAAEIVGVQYEEGIVAYFDYLDARRTAVRAELARIDAIAGHRLATVDVFRALGVDPTTN